MDRILRRSQLLAMIGVSSSTQRRMELAGNFPARVKVGKVAVGWHLTEVEEWVKNRERVPITPGYLSPPMFPTTNPNDR